LTPDHGCEIWAPIPIAEYEGLYEASNLGRIRRIAGRFAREHRILIPALCKSGYLHVFLCAGANKQRRIPVSRLVLLAFRGPPPFPGAMCCHNDGSSTNNVEWNLRWGSARDNADDKIKHNLRRKVRDLRLRQELDPDFQRQLADLLRRAL
jgi:hypothetical protein